MRYRVIIVTGLLAVSMQARAFLKGADQPLPVRHGRPVVAAVNADAIYLDEFLRERGLSANRTRLRQGQGTAEDIALLDRLIAIKLIVGEAATMGLDEIPELRKQAEVSSREILREVLIERLVKDIKPDAAAVEKLFRASVREWKTTSLLFQNEEAAKRAQKEIAGGAAIADVAAKAVAAKSATKSGDDAYHSTKDYLPQIAEAIGTLQTGQVSPVIRIQTGFVVLKVVDIRYPENAEARAAAQKQIVSQAQVKFLQAHEQELRRQYVVVNKALLKGLDFEAAKPGVDALLKDKRAVAEIKGAPSVTVGDLTDYLRMQSFHGSDQSAQRKRMNAKKEDALDATLGRRLLNLEAQRLGIDKTSAYRDRLTGYKDSLVFDAFVQKVIAPENKMTEGEVRKYYDGHLKEYSYPGMLRVRSLAFTRRAAAEAGIRKLREGADYAWLATNAEGQATKGAPGLLVFDGQPVTIDSMPEGLQKALAGVNAKDTRLYASPDGFYYVLAVQQVIASNPRPYDEVRDEISKKLYGEKLKKAIESYAGKLRTQAKVEAYLKRMP